MCIDSKHVGLDAIRDHARAIAQVGGGVRRVMRCGNRRPTRSGRPRSRFPRMTASKKWRALHGTGEHLRDADLHLLQRKPVRVAGVAIGRGQRRRQPRRPPIKEPWHVGWPELIAERLQARRVGAGEKPIIETVKGDVGATQLLLHPLVTVETELDRIGQEGSELQKRRPPLRVLDVEVVMIDGDPLARKVEVTPPCGPVRLCALNARIFSGATPITTTPSCIGDAPDSRRPRRLCGRRARTRQAARPASSRRF